MNFQAVIILFYGLTFVISDPWIDKIASFKEVALLITGNRDENSAEAKAFYKAKKIRSDVIFLTVECINKPGRIEICDSVDTGKLPELRLYIEGKLSKTYKGPSDENMVLAFLTPPPKVVELKSVEDFNRLLSDDNMAVIGAFENKTNLEKVYLEMAEKQKGAFTANFAYSTDGKVLEKLGTKNGIVVFPRNNQKMSLKPIIYNGTESKEELQHFFITQLRPPNRAPDVIESRPSSSGVKVNVLLIATLITTCVGFCF